MRIGKSLAYKPVVSIVKRCKNSIKPKLKKSFQTIPFVTVPLVLYNLKGVRDTANSVNCRNAIAEQKKLLDAGKIDQSEYNSRVQKIRDYYDDADKLPDDISSVKIKQGQPTFKGTQDDIEAPDSEAGIPHSDVYDNTDEILGSSEITSQVDEVTEILSNPIFEGVAAELLPGTKFLKPIEDAAAGDYGKAGMGVATRAGEIVLAPVKLLWAGFGGVAGTVSWLMGNEGEGTGFWGGVKQASNLWAQARNNIEDDLLGRKRRDPLAAARAMERALEERRQQIRAEVRRKMQESIQVMRQERVADEHKLQQDIEDSEHQLSLAESNRRGVASEYKRINSRNSQTKKVNTNLVNEFVQSIQTYYLLHSEKIAEIEKKLNNLDENIKSSTRKELEKQKAELLKEYENIKSKTFGNLNYILDLAKQYEKIYSQNNHKGFGRIAGYESTKAELNKKFGIPLIKNKKDDRAKVPNVILLYGPQGTGKTALGKSLASQYDCYYAGNVLLKYGDDLNYDSLMKMLEESAEHYKKTGQRSIIQINEVEHFGNNQSSKFINKILGKPQKFEDILSNCSDKYACTIIATTNYPQKLDDSLKEKMISIYVPPASRDDMAKILEFYSKDHVEGTINYERLADILVEKSGNGGYTNSRLQNIVEDVLFTNHKVTEKGLENRIKNSEPDIDEKVLEIYKK